MCILLGSESVQYFCGMPEVPLVAALYLWAQSISPGAMLLNVHFFCKYTLYTCSSLVQHEIVKHVITEERHSNLCVLSPGGEWD